MLPETDGVRGGQGRGGADFCHVGGDAQPFFQNFDSPFADLAAIARRFILQDQRAQPQHAIGWVVEAEIQRADDALILPPDGHDGPIIAFQQLVIIVGCLHRMHRLAGKSDEVIIAGLVHALQVGQHLGCDGFEQDGGRGGHRCSVKCIFGMSLRGPAGAEAISPFACRWIASLLRFSQ